MADDRKLLRATLRRLDRATLLDLLDRMVDEVPADVLARLVGVDPIEFEDPAPEMPDELVDAEEAWALAARVGRLDAETVRMARELELDPLDLAREAPLEDGLWKTPVYERIWDLHARRFGRRLRPLEIELALLRVGARLDDVRS